MVNQVSFPMPGLISRKSESEPIGIGAVSERFGLTHRALRFYEKRGLVDPIRRGRMRFYDDAQQMRLQMLIKCKQLGFSLLEIADLMGAAPGPTDQVPEVRLNKETILTQLRHLKARQAEIKQAIAELQIALRQFANAEELTHSPISPIPLHASARQRTARRNASKSTVGSA